MEAENNQEIIIKLGMFEQQIQQLQQQIQSIEQGINEITALNQGLDEIKQGKGKEILASIGRGIFIKSKIEDDNLIVDVGGRNFVKKSIPETKEIIEQQIAKLQEVKAELEQNFEKIAMEMQKLIEEARSREKLSS